MFDWDKFKNGAIAVHCDKEEKANDFLIECYKQKIKWNGGDKATHHNNYYIYSDVTCYWCRDEYITYANKGFFENKKIKIIKWGDKMEKTFREVIADIKPGEVWESENNSCDIRITRTKTGISIRDFNDNAIVWFDDNFRFKLKRKEYTFEEAFKALEEGKEIESCATKTRFKVIDEELKVLNPNTPNLMFYYFSYKEIKNKWYIN